jgi:hypothetical protein
MHRLMLGQSRAYMGMRCRHCPHDVRGRISGQVGAGTLGFLNAQISRLGLGEHAMTESDKIRGIIENAIESTFVN